MAFHLVNLTRNLDQKKVQKSCRFIHADADEVLLFNGPAFDTTPAQHVLSQAPATRKRCSDDVTAHLSRSFSFVEKWTWPGMAAFYLCYVEWHGLWRLHRDTANASSGSVLKRWYMAPRGGLYFVAGLAAGLLFSVLAAVFNAADAGVWASFVAWATAVGVVAFHPWVFQLQRLRGAFYGNRLAEERIRDVLDDRASLRNGAYDSLQPNDQWIGVREVSRSASPVPMMQRVRQSLTLRRHRASLNDPAVVASVVEAIEGCSHSSPKPARKKAKKARKR